MVTSLPTVLETSCLLCMMECSVLMLNLKSFFESDDSLSPIWLRLTIGLVLTVLVSYTTFGYEFLKIGSLSCIS